MHNFVYLAQRRSQEFSCEPNFWGGVSPPPWLRQWPTYDNLFLSLPYRPTNTLGHDSAQVLYCFTHLNILRLQQTCNYLIQCFVSLLSKNISAYFVTTSYGIRALSACQVPYTIECVIIDSLISDRGIDFPHLGM